MNTSSPSPGAGNWWTRGLNRSIGTGASAIRQSLLTAPRRRASASEPGRRACTRAANVPAPAQLADQLVDEGGVDQIAKGFSVTLHVFEKRSAPVHPAIHVIGRIRSPRTRKHATQREGIRGAGAVTLLGEVQKGAAQAADRVAVKPVPQLPPARQGLDGADPPAGEQRRSPANERAGGGEVGAELLASVLGAEELVGEIEGAATLQRAGDPRQTLVYRVRPQCRRKASGCSAVAAASLTGARWRSNRREARARGSRASPSAR